MINSFGRAKQRVRSKPGFEVVREMDGGAVGQMFFQRQFVRRGIKLTQVVDAKICRLVATV